MTFVVMILLFIMKRSVCVCVVNEWNIVSILMMRKTYICMFAYDMRKSM